MLQQLAAEALAAWDTAGQDRSSRNIAILAQKLQAAGAPLASFAVRGICNHLSCTNVDGPTELSILLGEGH